MKPLILEFAVAPQPLNIDFSLIEYSTKKNLSVIRGTDNPAITYASLDTATHTKVFQEPTDSDNDLRHQVKYLLDTRTHTFTSTESSDSDDSYNSIKLMTDTQTLTESVEPTDADR